MMTSPGIVYRRAITYGTFDVLHVGHLNLFENIKKIAEVLYVAVSSDEFNNIKGKKCFQSYVDRLRIVSSLRTVDYVLKEDNWSQKIDDILRLNIELFVMGSDWEGKFDDLRRYVDVLYLPRTIGVSSSEMRLFYS